jgi:prepilin peptidase CpaA
MFSSRIGDFVRQGLLDLGQDAGLVLSGGPASFPTLSVRGSEMSLQLIVFLLAVGVFTISAAITDTRFRRIPNKMTLPMFLFGLIFQIAFNGWSGDESLAGAGLKSGLLAFLAGFGVLFVLWIIGGGGGGDVKLMGALSVWLGFPLTLRVLIVSTIVVILSTIGVMMWSFIMKGPRSMKRKYLATGKHENSGKKQKAETVEQKQQRRIMAFAVPVAVAAWSVVLWSLRDAV